MSRKPRALDLFCKAGGATKGLQRAGFHVTGVDIDPQPRYCGDAFVQADALQPPFDLSGFDFIWASPPCQAFTVANAIHGREHPNLIPQTRELLTRAGTRYTIENVVGAPLENAVELCGAMFGLGVIRHRRFESNFLLMTPAHPPHRGGTNSHRGLSTGAEYVCVAGHNFLVREASVAMGIDWMTQKELAQAIPPAYGEYIGRAALRYMGRPCAT